MAQKILILGESGTGKSTSIRNCNPATTAIINPVGKPLPFRGIFETLDNVTDSNAIIRFMVEQIHAGKRTIIVDDFQYILSIPYMNRIKEAGWDKWNDFGANYFDIINVCAELPQDVTVYYLSHCETLDSGITTVKLIGKMLREKITIEGLFTIVLRTQVVDGKYYFLTQNSGKDTVKSPLGMFGAYAIENDLNYVDEKIRNYYYMDGAKSDEEIKAADEQAENKDIEKGGNGRVKRNRKPREEETAPVVVDDVEVPDDADLPFYMGKDDPNAPKEEAPTEEAPKRRKRRVRE